MICVRTMSECKQPNMCAPFGGCSIRSGMKPITIDELIDGLPELRRLALKKRVFQLICEELARPLGELIAPLTTETRGK